MTEQEHKNLERRVKDNKYLTRYETDYIVDALEEVQQYRAIGTPEECRDALEKQMKLKEMGDCYIIPKNGVFEVNGVNVNLAIQKQIPKKPNKCIGFTKSLFVCPTCGRKQPIMYEQHYCKECGQKLDWGDEE